jgi:hypothetical protein
MNTQILYHWSKEISKQFSHLSCPQARVLAAFSLGIALARRCTLSLVAERLWMIGKPDTVERRLQRFLANTRLLCDQACTALARWVFASLLFCNNTAVLLIDETMLQDKLRVMVVCLAYRGRAIPLAWRCYHQNHWPCGQVQLIKTLLNWIAPAIPPGMDVLVQADRGLGTSPELIRDIQRRGWYYLVRVQNSVRLLLEQKQTRCFGQMVHRPGQQWCGWVHAFKKAAWLRCWAIAYWGRGHAEPWLLLTNWPQAQGHWYGWRMWEELCFRDLKSSGWHWQRSRVYLPEHAERLWLAMAIAYVWMLSLGTRAVQWAKVKIQIVRGRKWKRSLFQLGLRLLLRLHLVRLPSPYQLMFISHANV